jgi:hypothetical protein
MSLLGEILKGKVAMTIIGANAMSLLGMKIEVEDSKGSIDNYQIVDEIYQNEGSYERLVKVILSNGQKSFEETDPDSLALMLSMLSETVS